MLIAVIALVVLLAAGMYGSTVSDWMGRLGGRVTTTGTGGTNVSVACKPPPGASKAADKAADKSQAFQCP